MFVLYHLSCCLSNICRVNKLGEVSVEWRTWKTLLLSLIWRQTLIKTIYSGFVRKTCRGGGGANPLPLRVVASCLSSLRHLGLGPSHQQPNSFHYGPSMGAHVHRAEPDTHTPTTFTWRTFSPRERSTQRKNTNESTLQNVQHWKQKKKKYIFTDSNWIFVFLTRVGTKALNKS